VLTSDAATKIITETANGITAVTDLLNKFLGFAETGDIEGIGGGSIDNSNGTMNYYLKGGQINLYSDQQARDQGIEGNKLTNYAPDIGADKRKESSLNVAGAIKTLRGAGKNVEASELQGLYFGNEDLFTVDDLKKFIQDNNLQDILPNYQRGTDGVMDFGQGTLAFLHGKEAVIPAPKGNIPVDLGNTLAPLEEMIAKIENEAIRVKQAVDTPGVNNVQSNEVVSKLDEMIGVLKTIADGQYTGNSQFGKEIRRLGNSMSADLFR